MTKLDEFRARYPGSYDHMSDRDLANAIYEKFYKDKLPLSEYHELMGTQFTGPEVKEDAAKSALTGLAHVPSHIPGIFGDLWNGVKGVDAWMAEHPLPGGNKREPLVPDKPDWVPDSEDVQDIASHATGVRLHQPETPVGEVAETGADVAGSLVLPGGATKAIGAASKVASGPKKIKSLDDLVQKIVKAASARGVSYAIGHAIANHPGGVVTAATLPKIGSTVGKVARGELPGRSLMTDTPFVGSVSNDWLANLPYLDEGDTSYPGGVGP